MQSHQKEDYDSNKTPKGEVSIGQIDADDCKKSVYVHGSSRKEIHIHIQGDDESDKKSKASKDRLLMLQAVDTESAEKWVEILHSWIFYLHN